MNNQNLYRNYSCTEIAKIAGSYHPIGTYRLICATFGEKYTIEEAVQWLENYTMGTAERFDSILSSLTERERAVLEYRFGLLNARAFGCTLQSIGRIYELTRERIRQIEAKALKKMRHPTRIHQLSDLLPGKCRFGLRDLPDL